VRGFGDLSTGTATGTLFGRPNVPSSHPDYLLFKGRFISDLNAQVLGNTVIYDFEEGNFEQSASFILEGGFYIGPGMYVANTISHESIKSRWKRNKGIATTYPGMSITIDSPMVTQIQQANVFVPLMCMDCPISNITWFERASSTILSLRYIGSDPLSFVIQGVINISSGNNNQVELQLRVKRASTGLTDTSISHKATTNGGVQGTRAENFSFLDVFVLNTNDIVEFWVANNALNNIVVEEGGTIIFNARE
jgi:hypothetical protein